ncbi:MAG: bifunctional phosphopantothenoylcysteine decarboxylase/phosphopantothenate--cysteine ligase CoaBC [Chloroflexi bacterium]|nr:bifunctional phosphopantothenoylcysteine decarboxylase/phosphopantothenate--cysteine ligase CoaBC [Chloroflexota bacterium]
MTDPLVGKHVILGVTGSIAAYKAADLASKLTQAGAHVDVLLTESATKFVSSLTFRSLTHRTVVTDLFDADSPEAIEHVAIARRADALLVAPATANTIAKLALGLADDVLTTTVLAVTAPVIVAPAMDAGMWEHPTVQQNTETLLGRGVHIAGPGAGRLASGLMGHGRMLEPAELVERLRWALAQGGDLQGRHVVVTAGGTQEPIDPVRVVTNRSSGKMGYAVAEAARDRGADVTLVTATANLPTPFGVTFHRVSTVADMRSAVLDACATADALVMAAAVSDYKPANVAPQKIKKDGDEANGGISLEMEKTNDFFLEVPEGVLRIGFAAETEDLIENARYKLASKSMALIVANDVTKEGSGFEVDTNQVTIIGADGVTNELPLLTKYQVGDKILDRVVTLLVERDSQAMSH